MPLRIPVYQQQQGVDMSGMPRASAPSQPDYLGQALRAAVSEFDMVAKETVKTQREVDLTDRIGRATVDLTDLEAQMERDQDFRTMPQRFKEQSDAIRDKYLQDVADPVVKQAFTKRYTELSLAKSLNVRKDAFTKERSAGTATLDASIPLYAQSAASAKNPAERMLIENEARLAISAAQTAGYIDAVEAGKRERQFATKIDESTVLRDLSVNPSIVADKLALDPTYASNLDPVQRERYTDQAYRRSVELTRRTEADAERERKRRGDELLKEAYSRLEGRKLTRDYVEQIRAFVEPTEYKSLLKSLQEGPTQKNDPAAYATLQGLIYTDPAEAERKAFQYHRSGLIKNETLSSVLSSARGISRQEGPRTPYEREKAYITNLLKPSDMVQDAAASARYGLASREFDDFAAEKQRTPQELRDRSTDIVRRFTIADMEDIVKKTGRGFRGSPQQIIEQAANDAIGLQQELKMKRISEDAFRKRMEQLNDIRKKAEAAITAQGGTNGGK